MFMVTFVIFIAISIALFFLFLNIVCKGEKEKELSSGVIIICMIAAVSAPGLTVELLILLTDLVLALTS